VIGRLLWWLLSRVLGDGLSMSDEVFEGILQAIREDAAAYGL
jgi:hypothetical protein